jgi:hypothetical protein
MKKFLNILATILLVLFIISCSEESNPVNTNNPTLTGTWNGTGTFMGIGVVFMNTNLSQSGASVSGSSTIYGVVVAGQDTLDCTVTGNNNYPSISLTSTAPGQGGTYMLTFTGTFVNTDSVSGTFKDEGSGVSYPMGMKKQ